MRHLSALLLLSACTPGSGPGGTDEDLLADFADQVEGDVPEFAANALDSTAVARRTTGPTARDTAEECVDTWGDCQFCWTADGTPTTGSLVAALDAPPCTASISRGSFAASYTVASFALDGSYAGTPQGLGQGISYAIQLTGARQSTLAVSGRSASGTYEASWTLDDLSATVEDETVVDYAISVTYESFGAHAWEMSLAGTQEAATGTISRDDGASCTISGTLESPSVSCTGPE
jgi:hypothetical protein